MVLINNIYISQYLFFFKFVNAQIRRILHAMLNPLLAGFPEDTVPPSSTNHVFSLKNVEDDGTVSSGIFFRKPLNFPNFQRKAERCPLEMHLKISKPSVCIYKKNSFSKQWNFLFKSLRHFWTMPQDSQPKYQRSFVCFLAAVVSIGKNSARDLPQSVSSY